MHTWPERLAANAWPLALLVMLLGAVGVIPGLWAFGAALLPVAGILFLVGAVHLGRRLARVPALRSTERLLLSVGVVVVLLGPLGRLPWALYQWPSFDNESTIPAWADVMAGWSLSVIALGLLMALVWLGWSILVRLRPSPRSFSILAVFEVALGLWVLALGYLVVQMDHTSEDILFFTLPVGLILAGTGAGVILVGETLDRLFPRRREPVEDTVEAPATAGSASAQDGTS